MVRDKVREDISRIERQLSTLSESFITFQTNVLESIQQLVSKLEVSSGQIPVSSSAQTVNVSNVARDGQHPDIRRTSLHHVGIHTESAENDIINDTIRFANQTTSLTVDVLNGAQEIQSSIHTEYQTLRGGAQKSGAEDMNLDHELLFPKPTFSLGLTQAERPHWKETVTEGASMCENDVDHSQSSPDTNLDHELPFPKPTFSLGLTHEECPHPKEAVTEGETMLAKKFANRRISWVPAGKIPSNKLSWPSSFSTIRIGQSTLESNDLYELVQRSSPLQPKVVDVLIGHISSQFTLNSPPNQSNHSVFMDTQFVSQLLKLFTKFSKTSKKESFWFPSNILERVRIYPDAERYYLPFNLDKKHWVSVCVDCTRWSIVVMDCNIALRTDSMMVKEVTPIAQMFPYLLKQGGKELLHKDARAFSIERPRSIPQNTFHADSAVSALLLVQAHAVAGVGVCKCITPDKIGSEVE
ncbi:uncharacterized protein LOC106393711 [Brassica napus]|uniref:uncharacterized protein LOC106393711 n=1 Tax=Brassica napus TaxID=3708 RepID=UPI0006AAFCC9|nr:uncharacterized protein LOC106393711 [Brassica napus]